MDEKEVYEICCQMDCFVADKLTESIVKEISYDMLEAHYGILPIGRTNIYRRRRVAIIIMKQRMAKIEEEKNGQLIMRF